MSNVSAAWSYPLVRAKNKRLNLRWGHSIIKENDEEYCADAKEQDSIHNVHDRGYKYLLSSKAIFLELLHSFIQRGWVDEIDESNIVKMDKSYILPDFSEKEADLGTAEKLVTLCLANTSASMELAKQFSVS